MELGIWGNQICIPFYGSSVVLVYQQGKLVDGKREYVLIKIAKQYALCKEYPLQILCSDVGDMERLADCHKEVLCRQSFCFLVNDPDDGHVVEYHMRSDGSVGQKRTSSLDARFLSAMERQSDVVSCDIADDTDVVCMLHSSLSTYNVGRGKMDKYLLFEGESSRKQIKTGKSICDYLSMTIPSLAGACNIPSQRLAIRASMHCEPVAFDLRMCSFRACCIKNIIGNAILIVKREELEQVVTQRWKECAIRRDGMIPLHRWEVEAGAGALKPRRILDDTFPVSDDLAADIIRSLGYPTGRDSICKRKRDDEEDAAIPTSRRAISELLASMGRYRVK